MYMAAARARVATLDPESRTDSRSDVYTGMLIISLIAMILGCLFLYLDYSSYTDSKPPALPPNPSVAAAAPAPAGGAVPAGGAAAPGRAP
jgi:hypothetical protein